LQMEPKESLLAVACQLFTCADDVQANHSCGWLAKCSNCYENMISNFIIDGLRHSLGLMSEDQNQDFPKFLSYAMIHIVSIRIFEREAIFGKVAARLHASKKAALRLLDGSQV
jgi:hypothetical protein